MSNSIWMQDFVTYDNDKEKFIVWDETQANVIGECSTFFEAIRTLKSYAQSLEDERYQESKL